VKNNFNMYAEKANGAIHVTLSGPLDVSRALDVLHFLNVYARAKQPIVVDHCDVSVAHNSGMEVLKKGLQRLSNLGHPIRQVGKEALFKICADKGDIYRR